MSLYKKGLFAVFLLLSGLFSRAQNEIGHIIKENKNLNKSWKKELYAPGKQKIYRGDELKTIGMPIGGIAAGQLYVRGDGSLACWWIANNAYNTGYGIDHLLNFETAQGPWQVCYQTFEPFSYFKQGFAIEINSNGKSIKKELNKKGFNNIGFIGEYPIARVLYEDNKEKLPVSIEMKAFSPFIPLNAKESATPGTILKFKVKNTSNNPIDINLTGHIQNMVMADLKKSAKGKITNKVVSKANSSSLYMEFSPDDKTLSRHPYFGNMALTVLADNAKVLSNTQSSSTKTASKNLGEELVGSVSSSFKLQKGEEKEITYLLTWYFPNRPLNYGGGGNWNKPIPTKGASIGNMYANWYNSSLEVKDYLANNIKRLSQETDQFHDSWYIKSNLPYWLKQRIMMPVSTLATETCQWWANDKFWAWEGVGSCVGTCTHVYNYEQAIARLFPELERNIREKTDFGASFNDNGSIDARNNWGSVLLDGHIGAILKAYREYLMSKDAFFLSRNWHKVKKAMEYVITQDGDTNGLIETRQSNTYDISFMGPNTYVGGLYLSALKAASKMATIMGDEGFASYCTKIYESGRELTVKRLWNGHYFKQEVNLNIHPKFQYANGCLSDQLFGQTWAHQLNLGHIYPQDKVLTTLQNIWKFNWTKDVGPHTKKFVPERYYAHAGEPGLLNCTWPISEHLNENAVRYRNEVWTGIEYQVATNMIYDGMIEEGLSIVKGVHERYRPEKHNPWNEIECGDHYARALASWGILIALEDYFYNGPQGILSFAPKMQQNNFNGFFTAAQAWGNLEQKRSKETQSNCIKVVDGQLRLNEVRTQVKDGQKIQSVTIKLSGTKINAKYQQKGNEIIILFDEINIESGQELIIQAS